MRKSKTENKGLFFRVWLAVVLLSLSGICLASAPKQPASLGDQVRHQLLMLPYYNVFDELAFGIDSSNNVTLSGHVRRPILRSDAVAAVRNIPGVGQVIDNIEVLPLSSFDDSIRVATYRAIFSRSGFEKYAIQVNAPIRIIVKNGNITLEGAVGNLLDKQLAENAARLVPYVFSVTNNLTIS
jgi:hyperosmotically inducible periplasmic protein